MNRGMKLFNDLSRFILTTSSKYKIDESHDISHSMKVLHYAHNIYKQEVRYNPCISEHKDIIYISATLHDMCDNKYMNESKGLEDIISFLDTKITTDESNVISSIISTMSYSKVKKYGFPNLGLYQTAYHIVREADLLSAYDFDRCIIYDMKVNNKSFEDAFYRAEDLFQSRVFRHGDDELFTTGYAITQYPVLHNQAIEQIQNWKNILNIE
jgi:HD superfamily phosphodiesterase